MNKTWSVVYTVVAVSAFLAIGTYVLLSLNARREEALARATSDLASIAAEVSDSFAAAEPQQPFSEFLARYDHLRGLLVRSAEGLEYLYAADQSVLDGDARRVVDVRELEADSLRDAAISVEEGGLSFAAVFRLIDDRLVFRLLRDALVMVLGVALLVVLLLIAAAVVRRDVGSATEVSTARDDETPIGVPKDWRMHSMDGPETGGSSTAHRAHSAAALEDGAGEDASAEHVSDEHEVADMAADEDDGAEDRVRDGTARERHHEEAAAADDEGGADDQGRDGTAGERHHGEAAAADDEGGTDDQGRDGTARERHHEEAAAADATGDLFSPLTGLSYRHHLSHRLDQEIQRAAFNEEDVTVALLSFPGLMASDHEYREIAEELLETFRFAELMFEFTDDAFCVILPNTNLDDGIRRVRDFLRRHPELASHGGLSSRNGRLVEADRILAEADRARRKAEDEGSLTMGFRSDPDLYRSYLSKTEND